ncbi:NADP-dependent oxidoreductase [Pantoea cypripedii]|uniref:NADP-dependent oxidoreductase n=1 Tax=Pantoea cypripedii TaxID=55209 RepID=UPI0020C7FB0A|nr:NADP-dependent oxidoreductase [Pantoea cypripedii]
MRVKVRAAGINPVDIMVREGSLADWFAGAQLPYVPGMDIAGTIDEVGDDVEVALGLTAGLAVTGVVDNFGSYGGYSEYVCLPAASVIPIPAGATFPAAASFLMNALTARTALDTLDLPPGAVVLVTGAAGAVGTSTVALGSHGNLTMLAVASPADEPFMRSVGAKSVIARGGDLVASILSVCAHGVDAVVDTAGLGEQIIPAVRSGGTVITLRPGNTDGFEREIKAVFVNVRERITDHAALSQLGKLTEEGGVLPLRVAAVYPAVEAAAAHRRVEEGSLRGRIILDFTVAGIPDRQ